MLREGYDFNLKSKADARVCFESSQFLGIFKCYMIVEINFKIL